MSACADKVAKSTQDTLENVVSGCSESHRTIVDSEQAGFALDRKDNRETEILGPLTFDENAKHCGLGDAVITSKNSCLLCDEAFECENREQFDEFLKHLLVKHKLVISDVRLIADFRKYIAYWKKRFKEKPIGEFCTLIQTNSLQSDPAEQELYYLLADILPEDKELRTKLQKDKLEAVLSQQAQERNDESFCRGCLFCRAYFEGNRADLFNHMKTEHGFCIGHVDNLVYADEYLGILQEKLERLLCLYCEKTFKDRHSLKEHMRKKNHKRINPHNTTYDRFYIINYLEIGKNWETIHSEDENEDKMSVASSTNDDWSDWQTEDSAEFQAVCLYCDQRSNEAEKALKHMKDSHSFDLQELRKVMDLSFYQQIKLINYIRRQMHRSTCPFCQERKINRTELLAHLDSTAHMGRVPPIEEWDQPQYYFPTFENDNLLCALEDDDENEESSDEAANNYDRQQTSRDRGVEITAANTASSEASITSSARKTFSRERKISEKKSGSNSVVIAEDIPVKDSVLLKNKSMVNELQYS